MSRDAVHILLSVPPLSHLQNRAVVSPLSGNNIAEVYTLASLVFPVVRLTGIPLLHC